MDDFDFEHDDVVDLDLQDAIGRTVEFNYYTMDMVHSLKGELIEVIPGIPFNHCRARLEEPFKGKNVLTFAAGEITNRIELIGKEE